ncbi:hypothetical protein L3Q82_022430 [Scortum barcoo]|uniref:Uncharacterized protein n=1 Tax=Scortum barcoo TaxID=214431 RepID=A0ACB8X186_9TELE|nr:hypothetical protein L3Q82_022430 [Scortum barcoo]
MNSFALDGPNHTVALQRANTLYPLSRIMVKTLSIPANSRICNQDNLFLGPVPKYLHEYSITKPSQEKEAYWKLEIQATPPIPHHHTRDVRLLRYASILEVNSKRQVLVDYY